MKSDDPVYVQLIADTVAASQYLTATGFNAAVVALLSPTGTRVYVCHDYWSGDDHTTATEFEIASVEEATEHGPVTYGALAVPLYLRVEDGEHLWRPFEGPPRPGEVPQIWALSINLNDGFDLHRSAMPRPLEFGPIETFQGQLKLDPAAPGYALVGMLADQPTTPPTEENK